MAAASRLLPLRVGLSVWIPIKNQWSDMGGAPINGRKFMAFWVISPLKVEWNYPFLGWNEKMMQLLLVILRKFPLILHSWGGLVSYNDPWWNFRDFWDSGRSLKAVRVMLEPSIVTWLGVWDCYVFIPGCFLKWWYPTTMGFPIKNDHFGVSWGYHHLRKHPPRSLSKKRLAVWKSQRGFLHVFFVLVGFLPSRVFFKDPQ